MTNEQARTPKARSCTESDIQLATMFAESAVRSAEKCVGDVKLQQRVARWQCRSCFYLRQRIGGRAITWCLCALCGEEFSNPSTATDLLCVGCAHVRKLCQTCGAEMDYAATTAAIETPERLTNEAAQ